MEEHDQRLSHSSSGHEGHHQVHHCHKCGWPFPNPHPSARHRRAHRRICGTIEGYKLEETHHPLNVSDDEHSDDDYKAASAKALERSESEKGSGGMEERSNRSEDEVFSDAASNFPDVASATVTEAASEKAQPKGIVRKLEEDAPIPEIIQADDSTDRAENEYPVVPKSTADVPGSKTNGQDHSPSSPVDELADSAKESAVLPAGHETTPIDDPVLVEPEPLTGLLAEAKRPDEDIAVAECLSESVSRVTEVEVVGEANPFSHDNNNARGIPEAVLESEEIGETPAIPMPQGDVKVVKETTPLSLGDSNAAQEIPEIEETCERVAIPEPQTELSPEEKASNQVSFSGDAPQVELDVHPELGFSTPTEFVHENDKGEEDDKFHVFSVPRDVPEVENPERIVEGFKDPQKVGWFKPDSCGPSEGILEKDSFVVASPPESQPEAGKEGCEVSSVLQDSKDISQPDEMNKPVDEAVVQLTPISDHENEALTDVKTSEDSTAGREEVGGVVSALSEMKSSGSGNKFSGNATDFVSSQTYTEAPRTFGSDGKADESIDDKSKEEKANTAEVDEMKNHQEERSEEISRGGLSEYVSCTGAADIAEEDNNSKRDTEDSRMENHVAEEEAIESAGSVQESHEPEIKPDGNTETVMVAQETVSNSHENLKEREINGQSETMQLSSEDRVVKEALVSLDTASPVQASAALQVGGVDDLGRSGSAPLQHEGETVKQPLAGSVPDASVDSISTDSLDANWGSVSVLSTQSDTPAAVEDSKAASGTGKLSGNPPMLEPEATKSSDTSEVFEPPSFMTLVEPKVKGEKTTSSSNEGRPGWFPSLTNVSNDSQGRKKNEEIIAKVSSWSSNQQQHSPLKSLLMEANRDTTKPKLPNPRENVPVGDQEEDKGVTVGSILGSEPQKADEEKQAVTAQEWNSPARYPAEIKREKRKVKGRPYWAQFVCCSSVN